MWQDDLALYDMEDEDRVAVLVVVVPSADDWARIREEGWYRIPIRRAPKRIGARYLAFYLTSACGPDMRWSVRYYAEVQGYGVATRRELIPNEADHPRASERYYRIALGPLQTLSRAIPAARLRRVTFIETTMARLLSALEINDLWVRDSAQARYARAFRDRDRVVREFSPVYNALQAKSYSAMIPGT